MRRWRIAWLALALCAGAAVAVQPRRTSNENELRSIAEEAYIYGYPLVLFDQTEAQATNVYRAEERAAPVNEFARQDRVPTPGFETTLRPDVDTLRISAFVDLSDGPVVLHIPPAPGRYSVVAVYDAYTNVIALPHAKREARDVALVGPRWHGQLPTGLTRARVPTNVVYIVGRTEVKGQDDLSSAIEVTQRYTLTPLSELRHPQPPSGNSTINPNVPAMTVPPQDVVARLDAVSYFKKLAQLLRDNPPPMRDEAAFEKFSKLGLSPGRFHPSAAASRALAEGVRRARERIAGLDRVARDEHGWKITARSDAGRAGLVARAQLAFAGLEADFPGSLSAGTTVDSRGHLLRGGHRYFIHFTREQIPAGAFWSLTMYDGDGHLVDNDIERFALGSRNRLVKGSDGSFNLLLQPSSPGRRRASNWLPTPDGPFQLVLRVYSPGRPVTGGLWRPPGVQQQERHPQNLSAVAPPSSG